MKRHLPIFPASASGDSVETKPGSPTTEAADAAPSAPSDGPSIRLEGQAVRFEEQMGGTPLWRSLLAAPQLQAPRGNDHDHPEHAAGSDGPVIDAGAAEASDGLSRRAFLQLLGTSATLAGLGGGCVREPPEDVLPYTYAPAAVTPGKPLHYATSLMLGGTASSLLVTSQEGRPIKVEGNPEHPTSLGATSTIEQASILSLYDPHRARTIRQRQTPRTWSELQTFVADLCTRLAPTRGATLRFLLEPSSSPLITDLRTRILAELPEAGFVTFSPTLSTASADGAAIAFDRPVEPHPDFRRADVIVSFDDDFLGCPRSLATVRQFSERRVPGQLNRLYAIETAMTLTGMMADHRFRMSGRMLREAVFALLAAVSGDAGQAKLDAFPWLGPLAADLTRRRGRSVVVCGPRQPAAVHAAVAAINTRLGNNGKTVVYRKPVVEPLEASTRALVDLVGQMKAGRVDTLIITSYNPVYTAPADLAFASALAKVPHSIYLAAYEDETAKACEWTVPASHAFESWGDGRAADGTITFQQPLVRPLYEGISQPELLATVVRMADRGGLELLRQSWRASLKKGTKTSSAAGPGTAAASSAPSGSPSGSPEEPFEAFWARTLQRGFLDKSSLPTENVKLSSKAIAALTSQETSRANAGEGGLELHFVPDAKVQDGRFANNAWLQELPDPVTKLTWDNAALIAPKTAQSLLLRDGDIVELEVPEGTEEGPRGPQAKARRLTIPVLVVPGQADGTIVLPLGYGRQSPTEKVASGVGANAYLLRTSLAPWIVDGAKLKKLAKRHKFAITQEHGSMEGRPLALEAAAAKFDPQHLEEQRGKPPSMYEPRLGGAQQWAMSIDLSKCTGCSACVVACQSENNIPVVGKEGVIKSREMHWLRIDRYYSGSAEEPTAITQPVACVHCEMAPCEYVCPVNATVHSEEGLNEMVYNRCVGTRYCSNNCPYKVRHFNYFNYTSEKAPIEKLAMNPDVTVRARGVMEKCTYCVQRIERVRIDARIAGQPIAEESLKTACQQVCPAQAIDFGSLTNPASTVAKRHADPRRYDLLHELGTRPRTAYLVRLKNPNPELG